MPRMHISRRAVCAHGEAEHPECGGDRYRGLAPWSRSPEPRGRRGQSWRSRSTDQRDATCQQVVTDLALTGL
jgi:hypothetical protein